MGTIESEVKALLDSWSGAIRVKDIDRLMALYAPEIVYFDVVPPLQIRGLAEVRRNFLRWFGGWSSPIGQEIRDLSIFASGHVATAFMLIRASGTLQDAREVDYWLRATVGCRRSQDGWLIAHEHISAPVDFKTGAAALNLVPNADAAIGP